MAFSSPVLPLFTESHGHLRLSTALPPQPRRPGRGFGAKAQYQDRAGHARKLREQSTYAIEAHVSRQPILGIAPELTLVLETHRHLDPEIVERAGLKVLEATNETILVAFAEDPDLAEFRKRCLEYQEGPRVDSNTGNEKPARYEELFDCIKVLRPLERGDVISPDLVRKLGEVRPDQHLRLDVQCWCPEDLSDAEQRHSVVAGAVDAAGGQVMAKSFRHYAGLSLLRVEMPAGSVHSLAQTDRVRRIDLLPRPFLENAQVVKASLQDVPSVTPATRHSPVLGVIDSGVRASHPLLAGTVIDGVFLGTGPTDGGDAHGHGTMVTSLALYGSLEDSLHNRTPLQPAGRVFSVRVLDANAQFPDADIWEELLLQALDMAAKAGARVINLSIGDDRHPYTPPGPVPVAAIVDTMARRHGLVIVISTGNYPATAYPKGTAHKYVSHLLGDNQASLLPPGMAALALTVGALCADEFQGARNASTEHNDIDVRHLGGPNHPSPLTRTGPGIHGMVKPELVAPGGGYAHDDGLKTMKPVPTTSVVGAGNERPDRLLSLTAGTSFAAPLVSHAALRVLGRYPSVSANAVRALLLSSIDSDEVKPVVNGKTAAAAQAQRRLTGYGRMSAERAELSKEHRAVLLAENELQVDQVHFYVIPTPSTFFDSGGSRQLTVALAYDPEVRATRFDYLASRMTVWAYRGVTVNDVRNKFAVQEGSEDSPSNLKSFELNLQPSNRSRSRGTHQWGTQRFQQRWSSEHGEIVLAVRSINRWAPTGSLQRYALAVVLERDETQAPLYGELRARFETLTEIQTEAEIE